MADLDLFNLDFLTDGNAPDAFPWFNESLLNDVAGPVEVPDAEISPFQADLEIMDNPVVPFESKKWMFDIILNDVIPYRYHDHFRLFPDIGFYYTLLYNRPDRSEIWGLVVRFHQWISSVAASSQSEADQAIEALEARAEFYGWPGKPSRLLGSEAQPSSEGSVQEQSQLASQSSSTILTPITSSVQEERAGSQSPTTIESQQSLLEAELVIDPVFRYRGIVQNMDHFAELDAAYERHVKRAAGAAPQEDASWPASTEQQRAYAQQLFHSITDLSNFFELRKAQERLGKIGNEQQDKQTPVSNENPRKRRRGCDGQGLNEVPTRPKGMSKTDWALVDTQSTPVDLLEAVIHHHMSGIEIELLCWRLLRCAMKQQQGFTMRPLWSGSRTVSTWEHFGTFSERWSAICENLKDCKMIIHSLTRADWFCKYAGAPSKERGAKLSNDLLNGRRDIQNQIGRDTIKEKTSRQDWITSDDFEIRDKDGELVLKGGHLGDRKRRELAVRIERSISK